MMINPDDFLETEGGRVWTPERNAAAWAEAYDALRKALSETITLPARRTVLVCGLQGAGKTTWIAGQRAPAATIYFDAALPGIRHRAPIVAIARQFQTPIDAVWIKVPIATALLRNALRTPDKIVPPAAIRSVARQFEEPTTAEGFDRVVIVEPDTISP